MNHGKRRAGINRYFYLLLTAASCIGVAASAQTATWRSTTNANRWVDKGTLSSTEWTPRADYIEVFPDTLYQTIAGFGGCFSEKGWDAIVTLDAAKQDKVIRALFDTSGCNFNNCRLPIGANDFAENRGYYSLDDSCGDYDMSAFTLSRDSLRIIPFIKAAMAYQPNLEVWASPWCPPQWMKTDGHYYGSGTLKQDTRTLNAYALYLEKAVKAFRAKGINITVLAAQNEPTQGSGQSWPVCIWSPAQYADFYKKYLIPRFKRDRVGVKLMWGTFCCGTYADWIRTPMSDTAILNNISIFGLQQTLSGWAPQANAAYPGKQIFQTETYCCHHNDWNGGVTEFDLLAAFLNAGAVQYSEWSMVLDKSGLSGWNWKQASMITIDTSAKTITYTPAFYGVKHWTHYIKLNARRIKLVNGSSSFCGETSAYLNPDRTIVLLAGNEATSPYALTIKVGSGSFTATLPAASFNTFVVNPDFRNERRNHALNK
jgi:glucosylceramidase